MKKIGSMILAALLMIPCVALASHVTIIPGENFNGSTAAGFLVHGDEVHLLTADECFVVTEEGALEECTKNCANQGNAGIHLVYGDEVHFLTADGCSVLTLEGALEECTRNCASTENIGTQYVAVNLPERETLLLADPMGFPKLGLYRWVPDDTEHVWDCIADSERGFPEAIVSERRSHFCAWAHYASNGRFLWVVEEEEKEETNYSRSQVDFAVCDLETFSYDKVLSLDVPSGGVPAMAVSEDGSLVYILESDGAGYEWYRLQPDSGMNERMFTMKQEPDEFVSGILNNPDGGWYVLTNNALYAVSHQEDKSVAKKTMINQVPYHDRGDDMVPMLLDSNRLLFIGTQKGQHALYTVPLAEQEERATFIIATYTEGRVGYAFGIRNAIDRFRIERPNTDIREKVVDIPTALITGDTGFDVMLLDSSNGNLENVLDKRYYVDLSDIPEIKAFVDKLYPPLREAVMRDGKIVALPVICTGHQMAYHKAQWEELGLGEAPTTFAELFQKLREALQADKEGELKVWENNTSFRDALIAHRIASCLQKGEVPTFADDRFLSAMNGLYDVEIDYEIKHHADMERIVERYGDTMEGGNASLPLIIWCPYLITSLDEGYMPLSLTLDDTEERAELVDLMAVAINPRSEHIEEAKEFLCRVLANMSSYEYYGMVDEGFDGLEWDGYQEQLENLQKQVTYYTERLANGSDDPAGDKIMLEELQRRLESTEAMRWIIRPEMMQYMREHGNDLVVEGETGLMFVYDKYRLSTNQVLKHNNAVSYEQQVREIWQGVDEYMQMWMEENK